MGPAAWVGILALPHTLLGKLLNLLCLSFLICKMEIITWHTCRVAASNACRGLRTVPGMQRVVLLCSLWWRWCITLKAYKIANSFLELQENSLLDKYWAWLVLCPEEVIQMNYAVLSYVLSWSFHSDSATVTTVPPEWAFFLTVVQ